MKTHFSILLLLAISSLLLSCSTDSTTTYRLKTSVNPTEGGTVNPLEGEYEEGETVEIKATAHQHWVFSKWEGDQTGNGPTATIMMDRDKNIFALFIKREYPLTVNVEGEGTVNERVVQQKTTDYESGTTVELTAVANEGWVFTGWQGDVEGTENPITIEINEEREVTAIFEKREYPLTVTVEGQGTVTEEIVQGKITNYPYQTMVRLTATASVGWIFSHWDGDLTSGENPAQTEVTEAKEVTAVFVRDYFAITVNLQGPGSWTADLITGNQKGDTYEYESRVRITVHPLQDWMQYRFVEWQGDLSGTENPIEVTVTGNITATAVMEQTLFEGEGTVDNPYKVATLEQLQAVIGFIDKHFLQVADIDASETATWNNGLGFHPIGFLNIQKFRGTYDGGGYSITGLTVNRTVAYNTRDYAVGLFGFLEQAHIKNLILQDVDITGFDGVGGLAGHANGKSKIEDIEVTGKISGKDFVGGLVGYITNSEINDSKTEITVNGENQVGGLIGSSNNSRVSLSRAAGTVTGIHSVGGLIGNQTSSKNLTNTGATADVTGSINVGGLLGASINTDHEIVNAYALGNVSGDQNTGGLIGIYSGTSNISETYTTGNVSSNDGSFIGGLVGRLTSGKLLKSYAHGDVSGKTAVGGLVGKNDADGVISEIYAIGNVAGTQQVGGLIGSNQGVLNKSYWNRETSGQNSPVWDLYQGVTSAVGLTTQQMTVWGPLTNMTEFDFVNTWVTSNDYPRLRFVPTVNSIQ